MGVVMEQGRPEKWDRISSITNAHSMNIYIGLGSTCNFNCHYCVESAHDGKSAWQDIDKLMAVIEQIKYHYRWKRKRIYNMLGGEPTLWPKLPELCQRIKAIDDGAQILMATNGSRTPRFWKSLSPYIDQVLISLHVRQIDIAKINESMKVLVENNVHVSTNVLMDIDHFDKAVWVANWLVDNGWSYYITMKPVETVLGSNALQPYTEDQLRIIQSWGDDKQHSRFRACLALATNPKALDEDVFRFAAANGDVCELNNFQAVSRDYDKLQGWHCFLNADKMSIQNEGDVAAGDTCDQGVFLGNLYESDPATWNWTMAAVQCKRERCVCGGDLDTYKFREKADADAYSQLILDRLAEVDGIRSQA